MRKDSGCESTQLHGLGAHQDQDLKKKIKNLKKGGGGHIKINLLLKDSKLNGLGAPKYRALDAIDDV